MRPAMWERLRQGLPPFGIAVRCPTRLTRPVRRDQTYLNAGWSFAQLSYERPYETLGSRTPMDRYDARHVLNELLARVSPIAGYHVRPTHKTKRIFEDVRMSDFDRISQRPGIMPSQWIEDAILHGIIRASPPRLRPSRSSLTAWTCDSTESPIASSAVSHPGPEGFSASLRRFKWYDLPLSDMGTVLGAQPGLSHPTHRAVLLTFDTSVRGDPKEHDGQGWTCLRAWCRRQARCSMRFRRVIAGACTWRWCPALSRSSCGRATAWRRYAFSTGLRSSATAKLRRLSMRPSQCPATSSSRCDRRTCASRRGSSLSVRLSGEPDSTIGFKARRNTQPDRPAADRGGSDPAVLGANPLAAERAL